MDTQRRILEIPVVIVGSGAAAYNAAVTLSEQGMSPDTFAILTEGRTDGTSRNTGSDKQTYYKLGLCGDGADSVHDMARDLFAPGCVDGDIALVEAALSVPCFLHLCRLGVPFPTNAYGEYVGYKTDHDPRARATSAGPLTSKMMTECLEAEFNRRGLRLFDRLMVIEIVTESSGVCGLLALDRDAEDGTDPLVTVYCRTVIWATGGPAGVYADTVYPVGHTGCNGVPFRAGVPGKNLTEWQFGLASVDPRWNVSGTYMQVLPRLVSVDPDGTEHEFLSEYIPDAGRALSLLFLKGYQWPFDSRRARDGSSVVDLLVYRETKLRGRKVYLDYTKNPCGFDDIPYDALSDEAQDYLKKAGACFGRPVERLRHMNEPAYNLYLSLGTDLEKDYLEIALCAQHNNGGLDVDMWWRTKIPGLLACGECAGTHGVYRPGGSALNAGQVGSTRAAVYAAARKMPPLRPAERDRVEQVYQAVYREICSISVPKPERDNTEKLLRSFRESMSAGAGAIREKEAIEKALSSRQFFLQIFTQSVCAHGTEGLVRAFRLYDTLTEQIMILSAMKDQIRNGVRSRGSAIYTDPEGECAPGFEDIFRYREDGGAHLSEVQLVTWNGGTPRCSTRPVRPLPEGGGFFENVWRRYREDGYIGCIPEEGAPEGGTSCR